MIMMNKFNHNLALLKERNIIERKINSSLKRTWTDRFIKILPDKNQNLRIKSFMRKKYFLDSITFFGTSMLYYQLH